MNRLICVLQLGTSRLNAAAAMRSDDGAIEVVAIESEASNGCISHGIVASVDETAAHIKTLMMKLNNRLKSQGIERVESVYVGMAGMSLHSLLHHPNVSLDLLQPVTDAVLSQLRRQSQQTKLAGYTALDIETTGYSLDGEWLDNPVGETGQELIAHNQLIIAQEQTKVNATTSVERAGLRVAGIIVAPLATADILTHEERQRGCILLDIGASTTTASVYAGSVLHRLVTIPLGSDVVTRDIASRGLRHDEAERLKTQWGNASGETAEHDNAGDVASQMPPGLTVGELNNIITCRYEEILANVASQIELSGQDGQLTAGCVLTGGAAMQKGLTTLVRRRLGVQRVTARSFTAYSYAQSERKPRLTSLLAMLSRATDECRHIETPPTQVDTTTAQTTEPRQASPQQPPQPRKREPKQKPWLRRFAEDLFSGIDDTEADNTAQQ